MLPAWLAGWPAADLATIYLRQAQWFDALSLNAPNIWAVVQQLELPPAVPLDRIAFAAAGGGALLYVAFFARRRLDPERMIAAALLASLLLPGLLPRMHERYFFLADVLAFALAAVARDRSALLIFAAVQISSLMSLFAYFSGNGLNAVGPALTMIAATLAVAHRLGGKGTRPEAAGLAAA
jgi:Gpi18-like mannosyltransferase